MDLPRVQAFITKMREVSATNPVVIFPGGGVFADVVRDLDARFSLGDDAAHWLAIHAMDSTGLLLSFLCPGVTAFTELGRLQEFTAAPPEIISDGLPMIPVWLPYAWLRVNDPAPHSWDVTADSLAVLSGAALGVEWVGLAKLTDHLAEHQPFNEFSHMTASELGDLIASTPENARGTWAVDPYLPMAINNANLPCKIFDARDIVGLVALILGEESPPHVEIFPG
jgi:hypothetical protein